MAFTGKATYRGGDTLPEIAEDVSDIVSIVSPYETPLLDLLGDSRKTAFSTYHEWMENIILPKRDIVADTSMKLDPKKASVRMKNMDRFRVGDIFTPDHSDELIQIIKYNSGSKCFELKRGYGGTTITPLPDKSAVTIISNPKLEGASSTGDRFHKRNRVGNWTQIFSAGIKISGSELAVRKLAVADELDYQKQESLRELLRNLECTIINGRVNTQKKAGSDTETRSMNGIIPMIQTNKYEANSLISGNTETALTEEKLNLALRRIWEQSAGNVDTIVCNGSQKRKINSFITSKRGYTSGDNSFRDMVSGYESDFGMCRVLLSRNVPENTVLFLDSSRIDVVPLAGRSFHYKPLAATGDYESGEVIGEYTLEFRNENAHGMLTGLSI